MSDHKIRNLLVVVLATASYNLWYGRNECSYFNWVLFAIAGYSLSDYKRRRHLRMIWRDTSALIRLVKIYIVLKKLQKNNDTIPTKFKQICNENPNKIMFHFENDSWTFKKVDEFSNQIGNFFRSRGIQDGDNVALVMENRLEYVPIWLGLHKIGAAVALINNNLTGSALAHSIRAVPIKGIIYGPEVTQELDDVAASIADVSVYCYGAEDEKNSSESPTNQRAVNLKRELAGVSTAPPPMPSTKPSTNALYVFTSGTTGLPKAAVISHSRYMGNVLATSYYARFRDDDVMYVPLPLYHTNGGSLGVGQALFRGITVAIRRKFSATNFWKDCIRYNCTSFIYIGEICRYLLAAKSREEDRQHKVRLMLGNGLRPMIWENFTRRFGIQHVAELYGSSEGIGSLMGTDGKVGAVGHVAFLWPSIIPIHIVEVDPDTEMPRRDANGRCIKVTKPGVPGMHISKMTNRIGQRFEGYVDKSATSKKIINNVFTEGDQYYVSGDVFIFDDEQYLYFQDRTGDTFRWRGENVSTTEVEQVISDIVALKDAAVYGVEIPGIEGRAGMAAILDDDNTFNLDDLTIGLSKRLPKYARPIFLRLLKKIQLTETYKLKKKQLKEEAYNPNIINDRLFYFNSEENKYQELTKDVFLRIQNSTIAF